MQQCGTLLRGQEGWYQFLVIPNKVRTGLVILQELLLLSRTYQNRYLWDQCTATRVLPCNILLEYAILCIEEGWKDWGLVLLRN
jgi:hypothetical protein